MKNTNFRHLLKHCVLGVTMLALVLAFAGCGSKGNTPAPSASGTSTGPQKGGEVVNVVASFQGFFAPKSQTTAMDVCWPALESLGYKVGDTWKPKLAESWKIDSEKFTVTLNIKKGVKFDNGDTFNANDVAWSLDVRNKYGTASNIGSPVSIKATDDNTVVVTYKSFSLNYLDWLLPQFMYSKETFDQKGENWMINNVVGTGPYKVKEYVPDDHLTYVRNDSYWGKAGNVDTFTWRVMQDPTAQAAAFMNGEIGRLANVNSSNMKLLESKGFKKVEAAAAAGLQFYMVPINLNSTDPLSKVEVRQALYTNGIDWDALANTLGGGTYIHTDAYALTGNSYYNKDLEYTSTPDYAKAKKALADAGYPDGFSTKLYYGTGGQFTGSDAVATYVQAELAKVGVKVEAVPVDATVMLNEYFRGKGPTSGFLIGSMYFTPLQTQRLNQQHGPTGTTAGATKFSDKAVELFNKVNSAKTYEEENKAMHDFVVQFVQVDSLYWPVYNSLAVEFYQKWCHYSDNARIGNAGFDPTEIWVDKH